LCTSTRIDYDTNELVRSIAVGRLIACAAASAGVDIVRFTADGRRRIDITKSFTIDEQVLALFYIARAAGENATCTSTSNRHHSAAARKRLAH
jgi:hypothetical protein